MKKTTLSKILIIALALVAVAPFNAAMAGGYSGTTGSFDEGDSGYWSATPVSSYDDSYWSATPVSTYSDYSYAPSSYGGYSSPSYSYGGGYSGGGYSYVPYSSGSGGGYVYNTNNNSNANANANDNTNIISNTFNPTNNNDARINLVVYGGGTGTNTPTPTPTPALNGSCTISPTVGYVNQDISFYATASGGNGAYSYSWTGDNGINSAAQSFTGRYSYSGFKTATVTIRAGSETITRVCSVNIQDTYNVQATQSNVTVIRDQNLGTPVSGVFLSQVPATGIGFGLKMTLFTLGLTLWSVFAAFMIARKKSGAVAGKIAAFKLANMAKKGISA